MSRLTEIQKAIEELAPEEKEELREAVVFYDRAAERFVTAVETAVAAIILKPEFRRRPKMPLSHQAPFVRSTGRAGWGREEWGPASELSVSLYFRLEPVG